MANEIMPQDIQPMAGTPEPAPAPEAGGGGELSDELLQHPVMNALMAGSPPAASTQLEGAAESPLGQLVAQNVEGLKQAGFGFYRTQDGMLGVMFNQLKINPKEIVQADQQGRILEVAPPMDQIEQSIMADPSANPVLGAGAPAGAAMPPIPGGGGAPVAGGGGGMEDQLLNTRKNNAQLGSPTSGAKPGAGRIANTLLKNVV